MTDNLIQITKSLKGIIDIGGEHCKGKIISYLSRLDITDDEVKAAIYHIIDDHGNGIEVGISAEVLHLEVLKSRSSARKLEQAAQADRAIEAMKTELTNQLHRPMKPETATAQITEIVDKYRYQINTRSRAYTVDQWDRSADQTGEPFVCSFLPEYYSFTPAAISYIGARPAIGKSTVMFNLVRDALAQDRSCYIYTYEETADKILDKIMLAMWCTFNRLSAERFPYWYDRNKYNSPLEQLSGERRKGNMPFKEIEEIYTILKKAIKHEKLVIYDYPGNIDDLCNLIPSHDKTAIVFLDYIQKVPSPGFHKNNERIADVSKKLLQRAIDCRIPIISNAMVKRFEHSRKVPIMDDLKDAGEIEQDANKIILLHKPNRESSEILAVVGKNRDGRETSFRVEKDSITSEVGFKIVGKFYHIS